MATVSVKQLDDITECPICREVFKNPRVLPCIHTYCLACIEGLCLDKELGDTVACPLCRKEFIIPVSGVRGLQRNYFVEKLLTVTATACRKSKETPCDAQCGSQQSVIYCTECQENLCQSCSDAHGRLKATRGHKVLYLGVESKQKDLSDIYPPDRCDRHSEKVVEIYCFDCKMVICIMCFVGSHKSHECKNIEEVKDAFREQAVGNVESLATGVVKCHAILSVTVNEKETYKKQICEAKNKVSEKADQLHAMIKAHTDKLLTELDEMERKRSKEVDDVIEKIELRQVAIESFVKYSDEVLRKGTSCDIVRTANSLLERTDELMKFDSIEEARQQLGHMDIEFDVSRLCNNDSTEEMIGNINVIMQGNVLNTTHTISDDGMGIKAVTSLGNQIFLLYIDTYYRRYEISVYDADSLDRKECIGFMDAAVDDWHAPFGMTACDINNCIYISEKTSAVIHRVDLSGNNKIARWSTASGPLGLSITPSRNVLVACVDGCRLQEFTPLGGHVRDVYISTSYRSLSYAVQLPNGNFVVVDDSLSRELVIAGNDGNVLQTYRHPVLMRASKVEVTKNGFYIVADRRGEKLVSIDPSLSSAIEFHLKSAWATTEPENFFWDESRGQIWVASSSLTFLTFNVCLDQLEHRLKV